MITRSQSERMNKEIIIDFDEASKAWRENKKSIGNGSFEYLWKHSYENISKKCNKKRVASVKIFGNEI